MLLLLEKPSHHVNVGVCNNERAKCPRLNRQGRIVGGETPVDIEL